MGRPSPSTRDYYGQRKADRQQISDDGHGAQASYRAQLGADRARRADLIARGYSPMQADASIGRQNDLAALYGQHNSLQQQQLNAQQDIFGQQWPPSNLSRMLYLRDRALQRRTMRFMASSTTASRQG